MPAQNLATLLLDRRLLNQDQLSQAQRACETGSPDKGIEKGAPLAKAIVHLGFASAPDVVLSLWTQAGRVDYLLSGPYAYDPMFACRVPEVLCQRFGVIPIAHFSGSAPLFISAGPLPDAARVELGRSLGGLFDTLPDTSNSLVELARALYQTVEQRRRRPIAIGDVLVRDKLISADALAEVSRKTQTGATSLTEALVLESLADDEEVFRNVAALASAPFVNKTDFGSMQVNRELVRRTKAEYVRLMRAIPISLDNDALQVISIDPQRDIQELRNLFKCKALRRVVVPLGVFSRVFQEVYAQEFLPGCARLLTQRVSSATKNAAFRTAAVAAGYLSVSDYEQAVAAHGGDDFGILDYLCKERRISAEAVGKMWADTLGIAFLDLDRTVIQNDVVNLLPEDFARQHEVLAVYEFAGAVTVAATRPNPTLASQIEKVIKRHTEIVFALPSQVRSAIDVHYRSEKILQALSQKLAILDVPTKDGVIDLDQLRAAAGNEAVVEFADGLLLLGVKDRASDIHIEPSENGVRVRFRIDGRLQERFSLQRAIHPMLVSRLKILANVNITERRLPQDGRISLKLSDHPIDFRFSATPTIYGEKIVLRVLGKLQRQSIPEIGDLFLSKQNHEALTRILGRPNGIFFVTGPTGSGKSMTLYSCLKHINDPDTNIMTIEDPVEYRLAGINQVQANHDIGLDFQAALRSFLRQDPDVILVGEIRDKETAKIATEAALTGHLVLATLHTNSALQAFTRLIEIGVDPYLVAPCIVGAMGQRLVRRICDKCKTEVRLNSEETCRVFKASIGQEVTLYNGTGCDRCRNTGFHGRIAVHEILEIDDELRTLVGRNAPIMDLQAYAQSRGYRNMHYDGYKKALRGLTTLQEVDDVAVR